MDPRSHGDTEADAPARGDAAPHRDPDTASYINALRPAYSAPNQRRFTRAFWNIYSRAVSLHKNPAPAADAGADAGGAPRRG